MMKNYLIGVVFLSCFFCVSESRSEIVLTQEQKQKVAKIDSVLNFYHEQGILNGTVLVAEAGKVIYQKGFGYANMDTQETLEPKSVFRLASVSKQFTAMCIMMLEEQNKLNYDDAIQKYLPELKYEGVTIRHLLWHTSGMPGYMAFMSKHYSDDEWYVNDDVLRIMAKDQPEKKFKPGEKYQYSNTGYLLLASIVERASGVSFKEFLHQNIFDKIGMSSSIYPFGKNEFDEMAHRVRGYRKTRDGGYVDNDYTDYDYDVCGDGGVFSSVIDLFKWNEALYTEKLVKQKTLQEAFKPYVLNDGSVGDYGFGWSINEIDSNTIVDHSGSWIGFRTHILRDITNKHCVIVLTNTGSRNGTSLYNACYNILMDKPFLRIIRIGEERRQRDVARVSAAMSSPNPRIIRIGEERRQRDVERVSAAMSSPNPSETLAPGLTSLSPGKNEIQIEHDGQSRRLIVTTPKTYSRQGTYPVLFCFHGAGGKADGQSKRWSPQADNRGLIVISAEAVQPQAKWNFRDKFHAEEYDDVGFVSKVVEILIANEIVDPKAVYATGHSSGGLFCYRLAQESVLFAALSPMSCGMVKGAHDPGEKTKPVSIMQVIGDQDKSYNGSTNPKVTMYSAAQRLEVWRQFNRCGPDPVVVKKGEDVVVYTYANPSGIEVAFCKVKGEGHHIRRDLRDIGDSAALDFLLKHKRRQRDVERVSAAMTIPNPSETLAAELTSLSPGKNEVLIEHDGQTRRLIVTTPKTYSRQSAYPVLFCFHGAGGKAEGQSARWSPQADKNGLIVISAEAVQSIKKWNIMDNLHAEEHDDVGFISKVVDILIANKIADDKAIFATGHSSGGLFSYRLAKETDLFAAVSPMSCGMIKGAHDPDKKTKPVSILQVIGDKDKSFHGSITPDRIMRSAKERIEIWRAFNRCGPDPVVVKKGDEITVITYTSPSGLEVVLCKVKDQEHHIRRDLRDRADSLALDFLLKHKRS